MNNIAIPTMTADSTAARLSKEKLYLIYEPISDNRIELSIPFIPDTVSYSYNAEFMSQNMLGRRSPVFLYTKGSAKVYSFSIILNEDLLGSVIITKQNSRQKPKDIVDFVNYIKMLSYPIANTLNGLSFPKIYFQLGSLAGEGIVNTSIDWRKPFRDGRYITVSISFTFTVEKEIKMPELTTITQLIDGTDSIFNDEVSRIDITDDELTEMSRNLLDKGYTVNVNNFLALSNGTDVLKDLKKTAAIENFDYQAQRLATIYDAFAATPGKEKIMDLEFMKVFNTENFDYKSLYTKDNKDHKQIKNAKAAFKKYLDYYYKNINTDMTKNEYDAIINEVYLILENLQKFAEEIHGYGASN